MNQFVCDICPNPRVFKTKNSLGVHKRTFHGVFKNARDHSTTVSNNPTEKALDLHIQTVEASIDNKLVTRFASSSSD